MNVISALFYLYTNETFIFSFRKKVGDKYIDISPNSYRLSIKTPLGAKISGTVGSTDDPTRLACTTSDLPEGRNMVELYEPNSREVVLRGVAFAREGIT